MVSSQCKPWLLPECHQRGGTGVKTEKGPMYKDGEWAVSGWRGAGSVLLGLLILDPSPASAWSQPCGLRGVLSPHWASGSL